MKQILLTLLASAFLAATAQANSVRIGSGADGLLQPEKNINSSSGNDVEVPFPGDDNSEYVIVNGRAGDGQSDSYTVNTYKKDAKGNPKFFSADNTETGASLGKGIKVAPGPIYVAFNGSVFFTEKKAGVPIVLNLKKIQIPKSTGKIKFKVFMDYSNTFEQNKRVLRTALGRSFRDSCKDDKKLSDKDAQTCTAIKNGDLAMFAKSAFTFSATGEFTGLDSTEEAYYHRRQYVSSFDATDYFSVLPGVYGIEWHNQETDVIQNTYGVVVK